MYHIHHTLGVITQTVPHGEANRLYSILTQDLGLVRVHAQGVRLGKSKLKSHLVPYVVKEFSFVRGKEIWRLTTVKESSEYPHHITDEKARKVYARILAAITRLVSGEEHQPSIFAVVSACLVYLSQEIAPEALEAVELITMVRILYELGYIDKTTYLTPILETTTFTPDEITQVLAARTTITHDINTALKASQL